LQAFNRSLILAPDIYGNPWLLRDDEFPKLARIYNLHRRFRDILVDGMELPESYGPYSVSRGDDYTRLITLRNLEWTDRVQTVRLDKEIGLAKGKNVKIRLFHPTEKIVGTYKYGDEIQVVVPAFRSLLLCASTSDRYDDEPGVEGVDYEVVRNVAGRPVEIRLLGPPGTEAEIRLPKGLQGRSVVIDGQKASALSAGKSMHIRFEGEPLKQPCHRKLADLNRIEATVDAQALYEATVFAADNNALEVRSLKRSGETRIPQVRAAREAFFNQKMFVDRGVWDKYLFDGDMNTGFWAYRWAYGEQRVKGGCFRLDLGGEMRVDSIVIKVRDIYRLNPLQPQTARFADVSTDLGLWRSVAFMCDTRINIPVAGPMRYLRIPSYPDAIQELEVYSCGKKMDASAFRASNLFARAMTCEAMWSASFVLSEIACGSYLSVAINGKHGVEGAYAAMKVDGRLAGSPSRARSYPSNAWEHPVRGYDSNTTYYIPLDESMKGKKIDVFVMGYDRNNLDFKPEAWISAYPLPYIEKKMIVNR
jgi:hypothetical protein